MAEDKIGLFAQHERTPSVHRASLSIFSSRTPSNTNLWQSINECCHSITEILSHKEGSSNYAQGAALGPGRSARRTNGVQGFCAAVVRILRVYRMGLVNGHSPRLGKRNPLIFFYDWSPFGNGTSAIVDKIKSFQWGVAIRKCHQLKWILHKNWTVRKLFQHDLVIFAHIIVDFS